MEIKYPIIIIVGLILLGIGFIFGIKKRKKYVAGKRVANTRYLKDSNYFKTKLIKLKVLNIILTILYFIIIISSIVLSARPVKIESVNNKMKTRDIFLCLDVSTSVSELDYQLVSEFKKTLSDVDGERIGIVIFNCTPYLLCPLTEDYDYVDSLLDKLTKGFKALNEYVNTFSFASSNQDILDFEYILAGTTEDQSRGSSLVGDALAATAFDFPKQEEDRTRIIILATDNAVEGQELVKLKDAAKICMDKNITIFGIAPGKGYLQNYMTASGEKEFNKICQNANGKLYKLGSSTNGTMHHIFEDIEKTEAKIVEGNPITKVYDMPEIPFYIILTATIILVVIREKEKI